VDEREVLRLRLRRDAVHHRRSRQAVDDAASWLTALPRGRVLPTSGQEVQGVPGHRVVGGLRGVDAAGGQPRRTTHWPSSSLSRPGVPVDDAHVLEAFLARWPSRQAMQHARARIRELTARKRLPLSVEDVVEDVNVFLRGWAGYFRYGNSARPFDKIDRYAITRLSPFVAKRHRAPTRYGWKLVAYSRQTVWA
jgi:Group II intron, maturase-specific domain